MSPTSPPRSVSTTLLWERPLPISRDRSARLTREEVAHAGFAIAETENLQAVSPKRVASRLGVPATRLETYLASRDDLLDLMLDIAFGEIDMPAARSTDDAADWRTELTEIALATHATARRHPWLVQLIGTRPPTGPNGLRYTERMLAAVGGVGLDISTMAECVNAMLAFVCGYAQIEPGQSRATNGHGHQDAQYLAEVVAGPGYPNLARLFTEAANLTSEDAFSSGLTYLLDGIERRIAAPQPVVGF